MAAVWEAVQRGDLGLRLRFVFCNRERGESEETDRFIDQVEGYGIPLRTLSFARFRAERSGRGMGLNHEAFADWRVEYDRAVIDLLPDRAPALVVLAGYMLVMTPELCARFTCLNLHPAAPGGPVGTWQQVIWQLIDSVATESGIFMHLVTPELDRGPVVTYCRYPLVSPTTAEGWRQARDAAPGSLQAGFGEALPLFQQIRALGVARELPLILATLGAFSDGRIEVLNGRPCGNGGTPIEGIDLTREIEAALATVHGKTSSDSLHR